MHKKMTTMWALAVASVTFSATAQEIKGEAKAGAAKAAMCLGCHSIPGYQASFPEVYKVPKISGQSARYIESALASYKKSDRRHPTMRGIAESMTEQDMADVAAFYAGQGKTGEVAKAHDPSPEVAALIQKGACFSCHGDGFAKPIDPAYPKVAGQYADYVYVALKSYQNDAGKGMVGRSNGVMAGIAKQFTLKELKLLAGYIGSLDGGMETVPEPRFR